jgi:hypothetical protein
MMSIEIFVGALWRMIVVVVVDDVLSLSLLSLSRDEKSAGTVETAITGRIGSLPWATSRII